MKNGDLAPSEMQICRELNVSRGIVREAFRSLATLGILEIESGKRPTVRGLSSSVLTQMVTFGLRSAHVEATQVLQLRRAIEVEAARLAASKGSPAQFRRLRECVENMRKAGGNQEQMVASDVALHITLAEASGNPLFTLILDGLRGPLEDSMVQGLRSRRTRAEVLDVSQLHQRLVERICSRDPDGAAKAMAHHFDLSVAAILNAGVAALAEDRRPPKVQRRR